MHGLSVRVRDPHKVHFFDMKGKPLCRAKKYSVDGLGAWNYLVDQRCKNCSRIFDKKN